MSYQNPHTQHYLKRNDGEIAIMITSMLFTFNNSEMSVAETSAKYPSINLERSRDLFPVLSVLVNGPMIHQK